MRNVEFIIEDLWFSFMNILVFQSIPFISFFQWIQFFWGEAHERIERLRMFHAQPFAPFSCISFKKPSLGAGHPFFYQRASFFRKIESDKKASRAQF